MKNIIYTDDASGILAIIIPTNEWFNGGGTVEEIQTHSVPTGADSEIVDESVIPTDMTFRNAWEYDVVEKVKVNINKAKGIAHDKRRIERDELFAPLDVKATIPAQANAAEQGRQAVRNADAQKQIEIDDATTVDDLLVLVNTPLEV